VVTARPGHIAVAAAAHDRTAGRRNRSLDERFAELLRGDVEAGTATGIEYHFPAEDRLARRGCRQRKLDHRASIADGEAAGPARRFVLVADAQELGATVIAVVDFALAEDGRIRDGTSGQCRRLLHDSDLEGGRLWRCRRVGQRRGSLRTAKCGQDRQMQDRD
jgi:hypothetical protein